MNVPKNSGIWPYPSVTYEVYVTARATVCPGKYGEETK